MANTTSLRTRLFGYFQRFTLFQVLRGVMRTTTERNLDLIAAGVAFYGMLAVFPAFAAVIAFWGFVSDPAIIDDQLALLQSFVPPDAFSLLDGQVQALIAANTSTLGLATLLSIAGALWSTRAGVGALIRGLNTIYGVEPRRGFGKSLAVARITFLLIGLAMVALLAVVVIPIVLIFLPLGPLTGIALEGARWVLLFTTGTCALWLVYRLAPNHRAETALHSAPGAIFALSLWGAASWGFSFYLANFGNYNQVYGSIGAVIVLLMWLFISAYAVLLGAAVNAEIHHRNHRTLQNDISTNGP